MTDFVLEQNTEFTKDKPIHETDWNLEFEQFSKLMINYAKFLKQPLKLGMFVPCDDEGNVWEYPIDGMKIGKHSASYDAYKKAEEKVLFEGFTYFKHANELDLNGICIAVESFKFMTIESLVYAKPKFSESAIKKIGL